MSRNKMSIAVQMMLKRFSLEKWMPLFILIGLYVVFSIISSTFSEWSTILLLLRQNAAVGIVALGVMTVIITGALYFTGGEIVALSGVAATRIYMATGENLIVLTASALLIGALVGLINGLIITKLRIQAFIVTLATMSIIKGLTMIIGEASAPKLTKPDVAFIGTGMLFNVVPMPLVILVIMILITSFILNNLRLGTYWYAIGGSEEVARQVGIRVDRCRIMVHMYLGICASVAALITVSRIKTVVPNISGTMLLDGAAAAIIGGTAVTGGKGSVFGTISGVFIISLIGTALVFFKINAVYQMAVKGAFILLALLLNSFRYLFKERKAMNAG
jgi:ribose/xylose/arabinose/galactoside ABC-type transport system permease subunit